MRKRVNQLYDEYENNMIDLLQCSRSIIECIFREPTKFGITIMKEDERSDFILFLFENLPHHIKRYHKHIASFATYLTSVIINLRKTWFRNYYHNFAQRESLNHYVQHEELELISEEKEIEYCLSDKQNIDNNKYTKADIKKLLIIGLKACHYLTPDHISHLSKITQISESRIFEMKEQLDKTILSKIDRYKSDTERIYEAYIKKNRCRLELMYVDPCSAIAKNLEKSYQYYTRLWQKNLKKHQSASPLRPSNAEISKTLDIKEHKVYEILATCKKLQAKGLPLISTKKIQIKK